MNCQALQINLSTKKRINNPVRDAISAIFSRVVSFMLEEQEKNVYIALEDKSGNMAV
jgi:hypothetical protein